MSVQVEVMTCVCGARFSRMDNTGVAGFVSSMIYMCALGVRGESLQHELTT